MSLSVGAAIFRSRGKSGEAASSLRAVIQRSLEPCALPVLPWGTHVAWAGRNRKRTRRQQARRGACASDFLQLGLWGGEAEAVVLLGNRSPHAPSGPRRSASEQRGEVVWLLAAQDLQ